MMIALNHFLRYLPFYPLAFIFYQAVKNGGIHYTKLPVFFVYVLRYVVFEPFRLLECLLFHWWIRSYSLKHAPVFILGHWRSGTSHLQQLLAQDPHTVTSSLYTTLNPDSYLFTESWMKPFLNFISRLFRIKYSIQRAPMDLDLPGELDPMLCVMGSPWSYTWGHVFPKRFEQIAGKMIFSEDHDVQKNWLADYDLLIRKLSFRSGNRQVIVKSPGDTARVTALLKKYPHAKFIYIHREPVDVFHSTRYLWKVILQENSLQKIQPAQVDHLIIATYRKLLKAYLAQRSSVPPAQLVEISFHELHKDPLHTMQRIYSALGMQPRDEAALGSFINDSKAHQPSKYAVSPELEARLKAEWDFAFAEWKY